MTFIVYVFTLLFAATTVARDISNPSLKPGATSFMSRVFRTRSKTNPSITLALSATKTVVLDLKPNMDLLSPDYEEIEIATDGTRRRVRGMSDIEVCWYTGKIIGDETSQVSVVDCEGYFDGFVQQGNGKTFVAKSLGAQGEVAVYASEDEVEVNGTCGALAIPSNRPEAASGRRLFHEHSLPVFSSLFSHSHAHPDQHDHEPQQMFTSAGSSFTPQRQLLAAVDVMEVAIVSDNLYMQSKYGGADGMDKQAVARRNIQLLEVVKTIYETAKFSRSTSLVLKAQYVYTGADPYAVSQNSDGKVKAAELLERFTGWAVKALASQSFDTIHLLTGYRFDSSTVGLAYIGTACNSNYKTGLSSAYLETATVVNILAHELGHNLGMDHDGSEGSGAQCAATGSLMGSKSGSCGSQSPCPISSCSVAAKNSYSDRMSCLRSTSESTPTTRRPTVRPTRTPTKITTRQPTKLPSRQPTKQPTKLPSARPSNRPTRTPSRR